MPKGRHVTQFGNFEITDDGDPRGFYGVWATNVKSPIGSPLEDVLIGSGMTLDHAYMVAESLDQVKAGTPQTTLLTESSKYVS